MCKFKRIFIYFLDFTNFRSTNIRGILLAALGIFTTLGSILLFSVGPFFSYEVIAYVGIALSVIFTAAVLCIPESPMYYVMKGT